VLALAVRLIARIHGARIVIVAVLRDEGASLGHLVAGIDGARIAVVARAADRLAGASIARIGRAPILVITIRGLQATLDGLRRTSARRQTRIPSSYRVVVAVKRLVHATQLRLRTEILGTRIAVVAVHWLVVAAARAWIAGTDGTWVVVVASNRSLEAKPGHGITQGVEAAVGRLAYNWQISACSVSVVARIGSTGVSVRAVNRTGRAIATAKIAPIDRASIKVVTNDRGTRTLARQRVARINRTKAAVIAGNIRVDTPQQWIARIHRAWVAIGAGHLGV
jgi:hypothetical protein